MKNGRKSKKIECEVCGLKDPSLLQKHHIIERTELNTSNHDLNLAIICANCHLLCHEGKLKIVGVFPSTKPPNGRTLIYELNGKPNLEGINSAYYSPKKQGMKIIKKENKDG